MSKRKLKMIGDTSTEVKRLKHWSLGLLDSMKDPQYLVMQTELIIVIRDKYPKSKIHYLILPHDNINSIYKLNSAHVDLLQGFVKMYEHLQEQHKDVPLKAGFHAVPSMQRLHMHVISTDMISPYLKTKAHWNSFTTKYFLPYQDVINELNQNGFIKRISNELYKKFVATPLQCNQCNFKPRNMPELKQHLLIHTK